MWVISTNAKINIFCPKSINQAYLKTKTWEFVYMYKKAGRNIENS